MEVGVCLMVRCMVCGDYEDTLQPGSHRTMGAMWTAVQLPDGSWTSVIHGFKYPPRRYQRHREPNGHSEPSAPQVVIDPENLVPGAFVWGGAPA